MASQLKLTELLHPTSITPAITINSDDSVSFGAPVTELSTTGTISVNGETGLSGQVLTSAGSSSPPTWTTLTAGSVGATTIGGNLFTLTNPSAVTFPRFNENNTVSALSAEDFRTAIGVSSGGGTVTSVSGTGTVSGITLSGTVTASGNITLGGTLEVQASNFTSQTANRFLAAPNGTNGVPTFRAIVAADIPSNYSQFPSGTVLLFRQTAAPTGWTKITTENDAALRVVSGTVGTGGTVNFSTAFSATNTVDGTTLSTNQIPAHNHTYSSTSGNTSVDHTHTVSGTSGTTSVDHSHTYSATTGNNNVGHTHTFTSNNNNVGHTHTFSATTGTVSSDHAHGFTTGGVSANHSHALSGNAVAANQAFLLGSGGQVTYGDTNVVNTTNVQSNDHSHSGSTGGINANHTHGVSGTTSGISANHVHTGTTDGISANHNHSVSGTTSGHNQTHSHSFSATTSGHSQTHSHSVSGTTANNTTTGSSHNHTTANFAVKYIDVIIASKD